ncbi:hypothetical protein KY290_001106, partial [Solanum tuberosum]
TMKIHQSRMTATSKSACFLPRGLDRRIRCRAKEGKEKTENLRLRAFHSCRAFVYPGFVSLTCSLAGKTGTRLIEHKAPAR